MHKPRILIVDDEPAFIRLLKILLENTGRYAVREESDATKAVDVAREFQPDLILLDYVMPKIDGGDVARELKTDPQLCYTPVVYLTATVVENESHSAEIAGCPAFSKPIGLNRLMAVIDENLATAPKAEAVREPISLLSSMAQWLRGAEVSGGAS